MIDGKLEVIDGKLASPGVASENNHLLWKNKQTYINFAYPRKFIFWSNVILYHYTISYDPLLFKYFKIIFK